MDLYTFSGALQGLQANEGMNCFTSQRVTISQCRGMQERLQSHSKHVNCEEIWRIFACWMKEGYKAQTGLSIALERNSPSLVTGKSSASIRR